MAFVIGVDFGTNSARAIVVSCADGRTVGSAVSEYHSGDHGVLTHPADPLLARQNPADYIGALGQAVSGALAQAAQAPGFNRNQVIGIGVDTTGSTPLPLDARARPLALDPRWETELAAQAWLWKDHTAAEEAEAITATARAHAPQYLEPIGGTYSSEWWWSKIWKCLKVAPDVFDAAASWVELADYVPAVLAGVDHPRQIVRGICAAGHKAMYSDAWGGLPDKTFLVRLDPKLADLRDRLYDQALPAGTPAGRLSAEWAAALGLPEGITIAMGAFDAHYGAIGSGIQEGTLVKIIGTSTCDCVIVRNDKPKGLSPQNSRDDKPKGLSPQDNRDDKPKGLSPQDSKGMQIPGICGIVDGSILPGYFGIEAGQSAVGDILNWWADTICDGDARAHEELSREAAKTSAGQSGLLALDWNNGNRTILVDPKLTGLMLGQTLHTTRGEIYRALIEATAFGARAIIDRLREHGVAVERVVCCGGIAEKNDLFMQIYADVLGHTMLIAGSPQAPALGAAISAAVTAGGHQGGYDAWPEAQQRMTALKEKRFEPNPAAHALYDELYALYRELHDAFGNVSSSANLGTLMKRLLDVRARATA